MDKHRKIIKGLIKKQEEDIKRFNKWKEQEPSRDNICLKSDYFDSQATHNTINEMKDNDEG